MIDTSETASELDRTVVPETGAQPMPVVTAEEYEASFGESLQATLDLGSWSAGPDLAQVYSRLDEEVREAVRLEEEVVRWVRNNLFPRLDAPAVAPKGAGVYQASSEDIAR